MRPPNTDKTTQIKSLRLTILIGLLLGILITALLWLQVPTQVVSSLFTLILAVAGLSVFIILRQSSSSKRWVRLLALTAAVSLVYLFPELFRPVCGDTPRAFASPSSRCGRCLDFVCEWNYKKHKEWCYCDEWDTSDCPQDDPPTIQAELDCSQWGQNNWCIGSLFLDLNAVEPQGNDVLIYGDVDGTAFSCPTEVGMANCSIPLPEGAGTVNFTATSSTGLIASASTSYLHDSIQPQISGNLSGVNGNNNWFVSPVDVNASVADPLPGSGIAAFEYNLNNAGWGTFFGPLNLIDGVYSLNLRAIDVAGNLVETSQTIQVDTVTPALNMSINGTAGSNGWYTSTVEVSAVASDNGSGLVALETSENGNAWSVFTAPLLFNNGKHSYQFRAIDQAGNITETSLQGLSVDTIPPVIDLPASWLLGQTIPFKLQDDGSGLAGLRVVIEDEDERYPKVTWKKGLSGNKYKNEIDWNGHFKDGSPAPPGGEYYAWIKVTDNAGNERMQAGRIIVEAVVQPVTDPPDTLNTLTSVSDIPEPLEQESIDPQSNPPSIASAPPVTSFGGGSNSVQTSSAQTEQAGFVSSPAAKSSQTPDFQSPVLWGASATAAIGAFSGELIRRREAEKKRKRAENASRRENRAASNYRQKIKAKKREQLEEKWGRIKQAVESRKQAALNRRNAQKDVAAEIEMRSHLTKAQAQKDAAAVAARAKQKVYDSFRAQEVAVQTEIAPQKAAWWENTKTFFKDKIISPFNSGFYQPFIKPAQGKLLEIGKNGALWINEALYQPYIKPALQETGQQLVDDFVWINENIYQPYVQPALEKAVQDVTAGISWANENVYQPYIQPKIENAKQAITEGIAWTNENIYQPYVQPALEKEIQAIAAGISWANENVYQPFIQPALEKAVQDVTAGISWANENVYQPFIQPALEKAVQDVTAGISWANENIYQPYVQPVLEDVVQEVVESISWANEKIYQPYIQPALVSINENIYQPHVKPLVNNLIDEFENKVSFADTGFYQSFIQPIVADINQYIYQPYFKPMQDKATDWWEATWDKYGERVHGALDAVGFIPGLGEIADGLNGLIYLGEGRYLEATVSALAMIPLIGDLGKGGKWGIKLGKEVVEEAAEKVVKEATEKAVKEVGEGVVEKVTKGAVEETAEKVVRESGEELVEKTAKEFGEEVTEKAFREASENAIGKTSRNIVEDASKRSTREVGEEVVEKSAKHVSENISKEVSEKVVNKTSQEIKLVAKYGPNATKLADVVGLKSAKKLLDTLEDDVIEYIFKQGPEAIDALSKWSGKELREHGPELAMRAKQDAIALEASSKLVDILKNMDPDQAELLIDIMKTRGNKGLVQSVETEARQLLMDSDNFKKAKELIETIASNSTHYADAKQLGLGKWVDYGNGFTRFSRNTGSVHYNPHPEMWNLFEPLGNNREAAAWLINKQVVETGIVKGLPVEFALEGIPAKDITKEKKAIELIFSGAEDSKITWNLKVDRIAVRWQELRELKKAGYELIFDELNNTFIFSLP